jgi:CDP-diglyceride synthetase
MNPVTASLFVFVCAAGGALLGIFFQRFLTERHISPESKDVVRLAMGLVATTVALVLGLLVASAKSFYDTQTSEVTQLSTNVLLLDRLMAHYGPEATEARAGAIRAAMAA